MQRRSEPLRYFAREPCECCRTPSILVERTARPSAVASAHCRLQYNCGRSWQACKRRMVAPGLAPTTRQQSRHGLVLYQYFVSRHRCCCWPSRRRRPSTSLRSAPRSRSRAKNSFEPSDKVAFARWSGGEVGRGLKRVASTLHCHCQMSGPHQANLASPSRASGRRARARPKIPRQNAQSGCRYCGCGAVGPCLLRWRTRQPSWKCQFGTFLQHGKTEGGPRKSGFSNAGRGSSSRPADALERNGHNGARRRTYLCAHAHEATSRFSATAASADRERADRGEHFAIQTRPNEPQRRQLGGCSGSTSRSTARRARPRRGGAVEPCFLRRRPRQPGRRRRRPRR